jgi:lysyl-tRNA synthetase class 2
LCPLSPPDSQDELIRRRLEKLSKLRDEGVNPYPYSFCRTHLSRQVREDFQRLESSGQQVTIAGRVMSIRQHGKAGFAHLQDPAGRIQIYVRQDTLGEAFAIFKLLDIGDFLGVVGKVFRTKTDEITVAASQIELLCKAIRQLPIVKEKDEEGKKTIYDQFSDKEQRYRQRYIDLIVNPEVKELFQCRFRIISTIRKLLDEQGFLEVETPVLQSTYGGAYARPFRTNHHALDISLYLKISPELYLKRLIIGGMERVYEISKNFRNEGIDRTHYPEFTMLEVYQAYADYNDMMELTEEIFERTACEICGKTQIQYQGEEIDLSRPWRRLRMVDALKQHADIDVEPMSDGQLLSLLRAHHLEVKGKSARGLIINALFEELVEEKLIQPTFIIGHPRETTPLCKSDRENPIYIERFEPFVAGCEFGNAYSELNDPLLQRELLEQQAQNRQIDDEIPPVDNDFLRAIEYGMPPTGGLGLGIDRLVMLMTNQTSIRDVILFPQMRPES